MTGDRMTGALTINGRFLLQQVTGVQRVAREVLAEIDRIAAAGEIAVPRLLLPARGEIIAPPALQAIRPERAGRFSGHLWEQLELPRLAGPEPLLCLGNTAPLSRLLRRRPVVSMVHDLSYRYFPAAYSWKFRALYGALMPLVLSRSARVVTVSEAERQMMLRHYPALGQGGRFSALSNGALPDDVARRVLAGPVPGAEARGHGLYVGSLTRRKNAEGILRGAVDFLTRYPEMRFVVIGATGASFEEVDVTLPPGVAERIEFRGQINEAAAIHAAYAGARFLLFPSFYESSGLPPSEAMSFGCPVIASDIPALRERCGAAALYCDPADPTSVAAQVSRLMEDPALWSELSQASRRRAAELTWAAQARGVLALCGEAAA